MAEPRHMVALTPEQHAFAAEKVASGEYDSIEDVVADALAVLREGSADGAFKRWLREEVVPAYEEYRNDPGSATPADRIMDEVRKLSGTRPKART